MTGRLLPQGWWTRLNALAALLLVATVIGCCGPTVQPAPVVVSRQLPPLLKDRRDEVISRWNEIAYVGTEVRMPADLWRLVSETTAAGWANAKALREAGAWEKAR